jgi:hypothetical protein
VPERSHVINRTLSPQKELTTTTNGVEVNGDVTTTSKDEEATDVVLADEFHTGKSAIYDDDVGTLSSVCVFSSFGQSSAYYVWFCARYKSAHQNALRFISNADIYL